MARTRFHTVLEAKVKEEIAIRVEGLKGGGPSTFEAYRETVGYIRGLEDALRLADEAYEDMEGV